MLFADNDSFIFSLIICVFFFFFFSCHSALAGTATITNRSSETILLSCSWAWEDCIQSSTIKSGVRFYFGKMCSPSHLFPWTFWHFWNSHFFVWIQVSVWYYIPFAWRISLKFLRCVSNVGWFSWFLFVHEDISSIFFSCNTWKIFHYLPACIISRRNSCVYFSTCTVCFLM